MRIFVLSLIFVLIVCCMSVSAQDAILSVSGGAGSTGDLIDSAVTLDSTLIVQGWSMSVCHPEGDLDLISATDGPTTQVVNGGGPPDFNELNIVPGGMTVGVVINFVGSNVLDPGTGYGLLDLQYELVGVPDTGGLPIDAALEFCDQTLGSPPVDNIIVSGGSSITPETNSSVIQIVPPPDFCLDVTCIGGVSDSTISWSECTPFDYVLLHRDGALIAMIDNGALDYVDADLDPGSYTYSLVGVVFTDPLSNPEIVTNLCTTEIIPVTAQGVSPLTGHYLGGDEISITGSGFLAASDTVVSINGIPLENQVVVDDETITGTLPASTVGIGSVDVDVINALGSAQLSQAFTYGFIRGVVNGDVILDIGDAMYIAMYLFNNGEEPLCLEAAESNGDGVIDIADSIFVVMYLFRNGPSPTAPFPAAGLDDDPNGGFGCNP